MILQVEKKKPHTPNIQTDSCTDHSIYFPPEDEKHSLSPDGSRMHNILGNIIFSSLCCNVMRAELRAQQKQHGQGMTSQGRGSNRLSVRPSRKEHTSLKLSNYIRKSKPGRNTFSCVCWQSPIMTITGQPSGNWNTNWNTYGEHLTGLPRRCWCNSNLTCLALGAVFDGSQCVFLLFLWCVFQPETWTVWLRGGTE